MPKARFFHGSKGSATNYHRSTEQPQPVPAIMIGARPGSGDRRAGGPGRHRNVWCKIFLCLCGISVASVVCPLWAAQETPKKNKTFHYDPVGHRDPFFPLVQNDKLVSAIPGGHISSSQPVLYGVLWDPGGQSIALINDGESKVGDMVEGYRVAEIRKDAVVLTSEGAEPIVLQITFEEPPKGQKGSINRPGTAKGGEEP